jgi:hypothetical protein
MPVVAVLDVRDAVEPRLEALPDLLLADQSVPARRRPARRVEHAVVGEERHDRVDVVGVERVEQCLQWRRPRLCTRHELASGW